MVKVTNVAKQALSNASGLILCTVILQILRMLKKQLGCDLTLDWIHHKFLKLNFLCQISCIRFTVCENGRPTVVS